MQSLSIIIPAYNEAKRLGNTLRAVTAYLERAVPFRAHEVIVVDDGSSDETLAIAEAVADTYRNMRVLRAGKNAGKGSALRRGILASQGDYILCTDADLSTPIEEVQKLLPRLARDGFDVAIGSRKLDTSEVEQPLLRRVIGDAGNVLIRAVLGLPYRDTQCGFKLYRREAALKLFKNLQMTRFSFDFEILLRAQKLRMRVAEVGVRWKHSPFTTVRAQDVVQSFLDVFRIRFGLAREYGSPILSTQLMRFIAVGVANTAVDATVYVTLTRVIAIFAAQPVTAKIFAFMAATICSLALNRYWTFGMRSAITLEEVGRFYISVSLGLMANVAAMYTLVHFFGVYDLVALVLTTGITFIVNFTLTKFWVFRRHESPQFAHQY